MQWGGKLSGGGTILLADGDGNPDTDPVRRVEIHGGHVGVQAMDGVGGSGVAPGDDGVGTLTIQGAEFELQTSGSGGTPNYYEWEIGPEGTDVVSIVDGRLDLDFSYVARPQEISFRILDAGGYVETADTKLDLFTYDNTSSIMVHAPDGVVQGLDADSFDTSALNLDDWTIGTLQLHHEVFGDGSGRIYLTGLSGGLRDSLVWDGGSHSWFDQKWNGGGSAIANAEMIINPQADGSGGFVEPAVVTVDDMFTEGANGPAHNVTIGLEGDLTDDPPSDATLVIAPNVILEVTNTTTVGAYGKLVVNSGGSLETGTATVAATGRLAFGVQGGAASPGTSGVLECGTLNISDKESLRVDWTETDASSMFGGTYTVAEYADGTVSGLSGTFGNAGGNIGGAYIEAVDYTTDDQINVTLYQQKVGDVDLDGDVEFSDLSNLLDNWGIGTSWAEGDTDFSGDVVFADLSNLLDNWGTPLQSGAGAQIGVVPEPGTMLMLIAGMAGLLICRKRR